MSAAEAEAVMDIGFLRGGRSGPTYWTDHPYASAEEAKSLLAPPALPEVRVEFRITNDPGLIVEGARVSPAGGEPGGGVEWMTRDAVTVEVVRVDRID